MLLYLLSSCPVFLEGYVFALSKQFRNIKWQSFVNLEDALSEDLSLPSIFVVKPVGFTDTNSLIRSVRIRYPSTPILGVLPPGATEGVSTEHAPFDFIVCANEDIDLIVPRFRDCLLKFGHLVDATPSSNNVELFEVFDKYKLLSKREVELFRALVYGNTIKEIGNDLGIPYRTLEGHLTKLKNHFGIRKKSDFKILGTTLETIGFK